MSDTSTASNTPALEETTVASPAQTTSETPTSSEAPSSERNSRAKQGPRNGGGRKPKRGDRRGGREENKEFREEILSIDRVTRVTAGGRQLRFRVTLVIGDGKGRVGLGIGKSGEVQGGIEKALRDARKNLITVPIVNGTIAHSLTMKFKASRIFIHPAHPGTGIIAGGAPRKVFAVAGIKDIIAKQHGAPNNIANTRSTLKALQALKPAKYVKDFGKPKTEAPASQAPKTSGVTAEVAPKASSKKAATTKTKTPTKE